MGTRCRTMKHGRRPTNSRGFSLLELTVSILIVSVAAVAIAQIVVESVQVYNVGLNQSILEQETDLFAQQLERTMREARVLSFGTNFLEFQVPIDHDGDGDIVDPSGQAELGAGGILGYRTLYNIVVNETFVEAERGYDLNGDGDLQDSLGIATIERNTITDDIPGINVASEVILRDVVTTQPIVGGDIDGDGVGDPIFVRTNFLGEIDPEGRTLVVKILRVRRSGATTVKHLLETAITSRQF